MQTVNLVSALNVYRGLGEATFSKFLNNFGAGDLKTHEIESLQLFVQNLTRYAVKNDDITDIHTLDGYYVGYCIPQIGKEFDLLKFGVDRVVNIELKKTANEGKILKQLCRNRYYLDFLDRDVFCFAYISDEDKLYQLFNDDGGNNIEEIDFSTLHDILYETEMEEYIADIDTLFDPGNYLVSPYNSTEKFIASEYFLTQQQEEIKTKIIDWIDEEDTNFISLTGSAGTGKTLLVYDIAKGLLQNGSRVLIVHCGNLNDGQGFLNEIHKWDIYPVRHGHKMDFDEFDLIIIDEVQRIYPLQLKTIIEKIKELNLKCIFSFDGKQCLSRREIRWKNAATIEEASTDIFRLTDKIRTNKEMANFIRQLLDKKINLGIHDYSNVEISYFHNDRDAKSQLVYLQKSGWKVTNYTPGIHSTVYYENRYSIPNIYDTPHSIIGQEFDNVVGVIDEHFYYNADGHLEDENIGLYSQYGMLYQILTRARKKIHLVIIKNEEILTRCLDVLRR